MKAACFLFGIVVEGDSKSRKCQNRGLRSGTGAGASMRPVWMAFLVDRWGPTHLMGDLKGEFAKEPDVTLLPAR